MKIDVTYIDELRVLAETDLKSAKAKLAEYGQSSFNVKLIKTKTIDNMVIDLEAAAAAFVQDETPMGPEDGLTPFELIQAMEQAEGKAVIDDAPQANVDAVKAILADKIEAPISPIEIGSPLPEAEGVKITPEVTLVSTSAPLVDKPIEEAIKDIQASEIFDIGNFNPTIMMLGKAPGYTNLPWWIYKWILENPDWKARPLDCPQHSAHAVLKSLIFYIQKDGSVRIRESRNSRFHVLE